MLVENELLAHGFTLNKDSKIKSEKQKIERKITYVLNDIKAEINYSKTKIQINRKNKNIVLELNEGFLCTDSIAELMQFNGYGKEEQVGLKLANTALETGLKIPKEIFVELFNKKFKRLD